MLHTHSPSSPAQLKGVALSGSPAQHKGAALSGHPENPFATFPEQSGPETEHNAPWARSGSPLTPNLTQQGQSDPHNLAPTHNTQIVSDDDEFDMDDDESVVSRRTIACSRATQGTEVAVYVAPQSRPGTPAPSVSLPSTPIARSTHLPPPRRGSLIASLEGQSEPPRSRRASPSVAATQNRRYQYQASRSSFTSAAVSARRATPIADPDPRVVSNAPISPVQSMSETLFSAPHSSQEIAEVRLLAVEGGAENLENRLAVVERHIRSQPSAESQLTALHGKMTEVHMRQTMDHETLVSVLPRLNGIEGTLSTIQTFIADSRRSVASLTSAIATHDQRLTTSTTTLTRLDQSVHDALAVRSEMGDIASSLIEVRRTISTLQRNASTPHEAVNKLSDTVTHELAPRVKSAMESANKAHERIDAFSALPDTLSRLSGLVTTYGTTLDSLTRNCTDTSDAIALTKDRVSRLESAVNPIPDMMRRLSVVELRPAGATSSQSALPTDLWNELLRHSEERLEAKIKASESLADERIRAAQARADELENRLRKLLTPSAIEVQRDQSIKALEDYRSADIQRTAKMEANLKRIEDYMKELDSRMSAEIANKASSSTPVLGSRSSPPPDTKDLWNAVNDLEHRFNEQSARRATIHPSLATVPAAIANIRDELDELMARTDVFNANLEASKKTLNKLNGLPSRVDALEKQVETVEQEIAASNESLRKNTTKVNSINVRIEQLEAVRDEEDKPDPAGDSRIESALAEVTDLAEKIAQAEIRISKLEGTAEAHQQEIIELQKSVEALESDAESCPSVASASVAARPAPPVTSNIANPSSFAPISIPQASKSLKGMHQVPARQPSPPVSTRSTTPPPEQTDDWSHSPNRPASEDHDHALPVMETSSSQRATFNYNKCNWSAVPIFSDNLGKIDIETWIFRIERAVKTANAPLDAASNVALERSSGTCVSWINRRAKAIEKSTGEMEKWPSLRAALLQRFAKVDAEALVRRWKSLKCARSAGRVAPTANDIETFWDSFDELLDRIRESTPEEYHPNTRQIKRQFLDAFPEDWSRELSIWMTTNKTVTLTQAKERAICLADADDLRGDTTVGRNPKNAETLAIVAPEAQQNKNQQRKQGTGSRAGNESESKAATPPKGSQSEASGKNRPRRQPRQMTCWRCGQTNTSPCSCTRAPKCDTCGGLHLSNLHEQAKAQYNQFITFRGGHNHGRFDRTPAENEGWWEKDKARLIGTSQSSSQPKSK